MPLSARVRPLHLLLGLALLAGSAAGASPEGPEKGPSPAATEAKTFLITLQPVRPEAVAGEEEKARITAHFEYLKSLSEQGSLILAGLTAEPYSELLLIRARDAGEAERILVSDPAVRANIFRSELRPFRVVIAGPGR